MPEPHKTPHGKRVSDAEKELRMGFFEDLMTDGKQRSEILEEARLRYPLMSPRTVSDYCARVRERWARESEAQRPTERVAAVRRLRRRCNDLWKKGAYGYAIQLERLIVDIVGLKAPVLDVTAEDGTRLDWSDLAAAATNEELEMIQRITRAADARKKAAGGAAGVSDLPEDVEVSDEPPPPERETAAPITSAEDAPAAATTQASPQAAPPPVAPAVLQAEPPESAQSSSGPHAHDSRIGRKNALSDHEPD